MSIDIREAVPRWTENRLTMRPGYYAGREPTTSDLDSWRLERIYQGLKHEVSQEASTNFVRFVLHLKDMSATSFLYAFEQFAQSNFERIHIAQKPEDRNIIDSRNGDINEMHGQAFALLANALCEGRQKSALDGRGGRLVQEQLIENKSWNIKADFLHKHMQEIPEEERALINRSNGYGFF